MSNSSNSSNDKQDNSINKALESLENTTETTSNEEVVGVEVVKGDKIIYEEGDFEEFNKAQDLDSDSDNLAQDSADSDKDDASQVSKNNRPHQLIKIKSLMILKRLIPKKIIQRLMNKTVNLTTSKLKTSSLKITKKIQKAMTLIKKAQAKINIPLLSPTCISGRLS
nr:hypothetical protein [Psychrobacter sp. PraFG1]UNK04921.1 hypothetical protein MN210_12465 [Psychrobacter sp. PraFG1]